MHWPPAEPVEQYWQVLLDLKAEGKVRAVGLSNHDRGQLAAAEALGHVDSLQPPFSLINRAATDEIGWCHAHRTGVIVYSPMQSGLLTGAFAAARAAALPADDWGPGTRSSPASSCTATWPWSTRCANSWTGTTTPPSAPSRSPGA
jgi:aryl-alcohol dehydrogenase-like predicted oxidoreductase